MSSSSTHTPSVVYEDEHIIALNKPAGIAVHKKSPADPQYTVADFLVERWPDIKTVGEDSLRAGIVHRLDKDTSGIMVVAKTNRSFFFLKNLFQSRAVAKRYLALVHGAPPHRSGTIDTPIGALAGKRTTRTQGKRSLIERPAVTDYQTIASYTDYTLLAVMPKTGRTHQIRVHLQSIGIPIVGDPIYGSAKRPAGLTRMFLHAERLAFVDQDGKALVLEAELPEGLQTFLSTLQ